MLLPWIALICDVQQQCHQFFLCVHLLITNFGLLVDLAKIWIEIYDQNTCKFHQKQQQQASGRSACICSWLWTFSNRNLLSSHWQFMRQFEIVVARSKSIVSGHCNFSDWTWNFMFWMWLSWEQLMCMFEPGSEDWSLHDHQNQLELSI